MTWTKFYEGSENKVPLPGAIVWAFDAELNDLLLAMHTGVRWLDLDEYELDTVVAWHPLIEPTYPD